MREIKFRGKHEETGVMLFGNLLQYEDNSCRIREKEYSEYGYKTYLVDENTVGQYTGLKDKNGKEIYEGDVLKMFGDYRHEVCYYRGAFGYEIGIKIGINYRDFISFNQNSNINWICDNQFADFEVIGNIYENPELLKNE